ncbi:hypothetical protein CLG85_006780 [Yangia mangrovi]|uniref:MFS transporter n=2 Tax=Alloyangia mangrovi TaxID=1779329 RepID=A0ABT2KI47_9RHOB|nr:hypothetical protein [Alloyangia mangrovi]MCT4370052.1 hypothetical protein [Alloyangia mangrovi]
MRVTLVVLLFPMVGFALATLAPISQAWAGLGGPRWNKLLTGVWSVAMPLAFLVTPQLVRVIAPRHGLDTFFAGFAVVVLLLIGAILLLRTRAPEAAGEAASEQGPALMSGRLMLAALLALILFEGLTFLTSLETIRSPLVLPLASLFAASLWYLQRSWRAEPRSAATDAGTRRRIAGLFAALFLLNVATTGFFDTAYLIRHACSTTLIDDRATLAALAQVIAATGTAAALARWNLHGTLITCGISIAALGLLSYLAYPGLLVLNFYPIPDNAIFVGSRLFTGFGSGMATTATIFAVGRIAGPKSAAQLFLAFVIIVGTEIGLEGFELLSQLVTLSDRSTLPPYTMIFGLQAALAFAAMLPLLLTSRGPAAMASAGIAGDPEPARGVRS